MVDSQGGSYEVVGANVCQNCGQRTSHLMEETTHKMKGIGYPIAGWIFFTISLLILPIVFGMAALVLGFFTYHDRGKVHGMILMFFAAMGLILGSLFSYMVSGTLFI
ncbi:hypothetical protein [Neobacillus jeddahensis]|uniref:hypothetical protein n=1 Tax=Neobacillus jeddahensis TaxID=1461580 RepID=UPI00058C2BBF|nr:hypothetical protein [Neobacillus jeddahensis]